MTQSPTTITNSSLTLACLLPPRCPSLWEWYDLCHRTERPAFKRQVDWETEAKFLWRPVHRGSVSTQMSTLTGPVGTVYLGDEVQALDSPWKWKHVATLSTLKRLLREARQAHHDVEERLQAKMTEKMTKVREEYEATIARHLSFVDRCRRRQSLSDKCDVFCRGNEPIDQGTVHERRPQASRRELRRQRRRSLRGASTARKMDRRAAPLDQGVDAERFEPELQVSHCNFSLFFSYSKRFH